MTAIYVDQTKIVKQARAAAEVAHTNMFAAFAQLQLNVQTTHLANWDSISVRKLEDKIDDFKASCMMFRSSQDAIIKAMAMGGDRPDTAVPTPNELDGKIPNGWTTVIQDGIPVLVPLAPTPDSDPASGE